MEVAENANGTFDTRPTLVENSKETRSNPIEPDRRRNGPYLLVDSTSQNQLNPTRRLLSALVPRRNIFCLFVFFSIFFLVSFWKTKKEKKNNRPECNRRSRSRGANRIFLAVLLKKKMFWRCFFLGGWGFPENFKENGPRRSLNVNEVRYPRLKVRCRSPHDSRGDRAA